MLHMSIMQEDKFEEVLDMALSYIWKTMHNATVRVYLHHFK